MNTAGFKPETKKIQNNSSQETVKQKIGKSFVVAIAPGVSTVMLRIGVIGWASEH